MAPLDDLQRHLRRVRWRLLWVLVSFGLGASLTWYHRVTIFGYLLAPAGDELSGTGLPIFTGPTEMLSAVVRVAVMGGLVVATPVAIFHLARFFSPVMSPQMRRFAIIFLPMGLLFYVAGVAFAYFVLLPAGMGFLLGFGTDIATPMIRISEYLEIATAMIFWLGFVFELPLAMMLLSRLGLMTPGRFQRMMWIVPPAAFIFAAFITPTFDGFNQTLVAIPIIVLWEVGVVLAWVARPRAPRTV